MFRMSNDAVDPITLEVLRNRLEAIAQEMQDALVRSAYSNIIKEGHDCSAALFDSGGEVIAQATALPAQLGVLRRQLSAWSRSLRANCPTATYWPSTIPMMAARICPTFV